VPGMYCKDKLALYRSDPSDRTNLLGVLKVLKESLLVPCHTLVDVGSSVGEAVGLTRLATEDSEISLVSAKPPRPVAAVNAPMEVRANFVGLTSTEGMALSTTSLEEGSSLSRVT
jgi:hypothetical protein